MKKNIALFGGTGGLGSKLSKELESKYNVLSIGSKDVNVQDFEEVESFFANNDIDIVLNFSGVNYDSFMHKYDKSNIDNVDRLININIKGTTNIISNSLIKMRKKKYGRIILVSSILAESPVVSTGVYAGCKGFIDSISKTVAIENATKGITCNSIQLGYFDGGLTYNIPEEFRNSIIKTIPMKRLGSVTELSKLIDMLIEVDYITGTNIKINGGLDF